MEHGEGEIVSPIDTTEYLRHINRYVRLNRYCAMYAVSTIGMRPTKIGISSDLNARLGSIQSGNWHEVFMYYAVWFPGKELAALIWGAARLKLFHKRINGEWFDTTPAEVRRFVSEEMASKTWNGLKIIEHSEIIGLLKTKNHLTSADNRGIRSNDKQSQDCARPIGAETFDVDPFVDPKRLWRKFT